MAHVLPQLLLTLAEITTPMELGAEECNDAVHNDGAKGPLVSVGEQRGYGLHNLNLLLVGENTTHNHIIQRLFHIETKTLRNRFHALRAKIALGVDVDDLALSTTRLKC